MFKHEPLDDEIIEQQIATRSDETMKIDLAYALESLPAHYLDVVLLRDFEELIIAEIVGCLGDSNGAVKSLSEKNTQNLQFDRSEKLSDSN